MHSSLFLAIPAQRVDSKGSRKRLWFCSFKLRDYWNAKSGFSAHQHHNSLEYSKNGSEESSNFVGIPTAFIFEILIAMRRH